MIGQVNGYKCEVVARTLYREQEICLGSYEATHPEFALGWLRSQAARLANALSPRPGVGPLPVSALREVSENIPDPGRIFRHWIWDFATQEKQLILLATGRRVIVRAADLGAVYSLTALPVLVSTDADPTLTLAAVA